MLNDMDRQFLERLSQDHEGTKEFLTQLLGDPTLFPVELKAWLTSYIEANPPVLPISTIFGFTQYTVRYATTTNSNTSVSSTYATLGISADLSHLANGQYIMGCGCFASTTNAGTSYATMGIAKDGNYGTLISSSSALGAAATLSTVNTSITGFGIATLTNANDNTVSTVFASTGGASCSFRDPWILTLKYANA